MFLLLAGIVLSSCSSGKIPCPDVSGKKSLNPLSMFKKNEPTPEDQAKEGTDIGGRNMEFGAKDGLLKKKKVKLPGTKKKKKIVTKLGKGPGRK
ncbi:hypothetical protein GU926_10490 [Nibribacter ruber]|uniref:Uncharacterized protein n=1 Tax=Nibribacter ruber TaxID=2698458 RepID=A0A6P1P1K9_9BACT|nr:hypothetical protein [Nibribacter ruber]QHL87833.1 hypothetical protein GU926_10490 [Nibribacter ruber]